MTVLLAAALDCGVGRRSEGEKRDLLMQDAPDDLFEALMQRMTPEQRARVPEASRLLREPLHPNCYLTPTQRGIAPPQQEPAAEAEADAPPSERSPRPDQPAPVLSPDERRRASQSYRRQKKRR